MRFLKGKISERIQQRPPDLMRSGDISALKELLRSSERGITIPFIDLPRIGTIPDILFCHGGSIFSE
jgi:hypothetical protein